MIPLWYTPEGVAPPATCMHTGSFRLAAPSGPDGTAGRVWGSPWDARRAQHWHQARGASWWFNGHGCTPDDLLRLARLPGPLVAGAAVGITWQVPALIQRAERGWQACPHLCEYRDYRWQVRTDVAGIVDRLRRVVDWDGDAASAIDDDATVALVADVLGLNYHLGQDELAATGWLDQRAPVEILKAACHG